MMRIELHPHDQAFRNEYSQSESERGMNYLYMMNFDKEPLL